MNTELLKQIALHNSVVAYAIYTLTVIALTIWIARTIHRNTHPFLLEIFPNHENVALAVNNLLQMGFYLLSFGYGFLKLRIRYSPSWFNNYDEAAAQQFMTTSKDTIEEVAIKLGSFTLFAGSLLFFNLFLMLMLRKSNKNSKLREQQFQQYIQQQPNQ